MPLMQIGNYRLGNTLGVGSFGKVKLAVHVPTGKKVAVKILNRQKIHHQQMEEKLKREIKILKACLHPHIIRLYEVIETSTDVFVVTEYSSGGELFDYIVERGRLAEAEARRFFQQIVSGVEYCHKHMIAHRDLKPENLLLDEHSNVKIADFGLSNCMRDGWFLKTSCGSPNYAAPEVISGKLYAGPEVDIWSCGIIVYALLCGALPFDDESIPYLFRKIKGGVYILPSYLSDTSKDLISKMLVVDPLKRIKMDEIRKHPWFLQELPRYLAMPVRIGSHLEHIDETVLEQVVQVTHFPKERIRIALRKGMRNHYTVAYHLIKDSQDELDTSLDSSSQDLSSDGNNLTHRNSRSNNPSIEQSPMITDVPQNSHTEMLVSPAPNPMAVQDQRMRMQRDYRMYNDPFRNVIAKREWDVGIRCSQRNPADAMMEVYRALHVLQWRWKTPPNQSFQIRALIAKPDPDPDVRLCLQLYKSTSGYQLDIQRIDGELIAYFVACSDLMRELGS